MFRCIKTFSSSQFVPLYLNNHFMLMVKIIASIKLNITAKMNDLFLTLIVLILNHKFYQTLSITIVRNLRGSPLAKGRQVITLIVFLKCSCSLINAFHCT